MDFCKRTSGCPCPQCDQEPTPQLASHVGNKYIQLASHVDSHVSMTGFSNSHPKGSTRSRRYPSSGLQGVEFSVTDPATYLGWGDGGHRCSSFPCPICHRGYQQACSYSSPKNGNKTTSNDHVQVPFVSQLRDKEHLVCETIPCKVCGRKWRWSTGPWNQVTRSNLIWFSAHC